MPTRRAVIGGLGALAAGPFVSGCVSPALLRPPENAVPLYISASDEFTVPVRLNGQEGLTFKLDTGAAMSALYEEFADLGEAPAVGERVDVWGLGGSAVRPVRYLRALELGGAVYGNWRVAVLTGRKSQTNAVGILGMDILKHWAFETQISTGQNLLYPVADVNWRRFSGWRRVPLVEDPFQTHAFGLKFGWITVMGTRVPALFDTGSQLSIMNWEAARLVPDLRKYWDVAYESWRYHGAVGTFRVSATAELSDVRMGRHVWDQVEFVVTDLESLSILGSAGQPLMIAGANMFTARDLVFDPSRSEIRIRGRRDVSPGVVLR